jgi:predicted enzyme related to lactoylglutathione lyase
MGGCFWFSYTIECSPTWFPSVSWTTAMKPFGAISADGSIVYLNARDQMDAMLARVESAGGTVILPRTEIAPNGFIAVVQDTEGNHVGLHSMV